MPYLLPQPHLHVNVELVHAAIICCLNLGDARIANALRKTHFNKEYASEENKIQRLNPTLARAAQHQLTCGSVYPNCGGNRIELGVQLSQNTCPQNRQWCLRRNMPKDAWHASQLSTISALIHSTRVSLSDAARPAMRRLKAFGCVRKAMRASFLDVTRFGSR